jgi:hypothetical protein
MLLFVLEKDAQDSPIAGPHLYSHPYDLMIAEHRIRSLPLPACFEGGCKGMSLVAKDVWPQFQDD